VPPGVVVTDSSGTGVSAREEEDDDYERYEGGGGNREFDVEGLFEDL